MLWNYQDKFNLFTYQLCLETHSNLFCSQFCWQKRHTVLQDVEARSLDMECMAFGFENFEAGGPICWQNGTIF